MFLKWIELCRKVSYVIVYVMYYRWRWVTAVPKRSIFLKIDEAKQEFIYRNKNNYVIARITCYVIIYKIKNPPKPKKRGGRFSLNSVKSPKNKMAISLPTYNPHRIKHQVRGLCVGGVGCPPRRYGHFIFRNFTKFR